MAKLLGERLIEAGMISEVDLKRAIDFQLENGGRLGNTLVSLKILDQDSLTRFISSNQLNNRSLLGEVLVTKEYITQDQLDSALDFQKKSGGQLGEILLSLDYISSADLYRVLASQMQIGRTGIKVDFKDAKKIPYNIALKHNSILINTREDEYIVAVNNRLEDSALSEIQSYLDKPVEQVLATMQEIEEFWEIVYNYEESEDSIYKLFNEQPLNSALIVLSRGQKIVCLGILIGFILMFVLDWFKTLLVLNIILQIMYAVFTLLKLWILIKGFKTRKQLRYTKMEIENIDDRDLPIYTILVPIYKEAEIAHLLVERLNNIDYPRHKLDIRILLEEDDKETFEALNNIELPNCYTLLIVPTSQPKTKPKACNYGLIRAKGERVVIYDAEDLPEPDQLKKVYLAFKDLPESYVCIQSKLNYFNSNQNILTKWFTQEYSSWFDILLPGIMTFDTPIPLGGTSNHFKADFLKQVGAWDPFNVTEDADLGIRLYKLHYHTAVLDSHTWEEANSNLKNWINQRSRWIKGYLQTWFVHMRHPVKLYKDLDGIKGFIGYQTMVLGTPLIPLLNPLFWLMLILWYCFEPEVISMFFPSVLFYIASIQFLLGNFLFVYSNVIGAYTVIRESEESGNMFIGYNIVIWGLLLPFYWILMSIAAYKALFQLIKKPFYWEKTSHGLTEQNKLKRVDV